MKLSSIKSKGKLRMSNSTNRSFKLDDNIHHIQKVESVVNRLLTDRELAYILRGYAGDCKRRGSYLAATVALKRANTMVPDDADILCDLGACLWNYGDYASAEDALFRSLSINPINSITLSNMGLLKSSTNEVVPAEYYLLEALRVDPNHIGALWDLALLQLSIGNWKDGLMNYESRMDYRGFSQYPKLPYPMWNGEDLNDKTIFIHGEQGMGDRILFSRYLYWLHKRYPKCKIKHTTLPNKSSFLYSPKMDVKKG